MQRQLFGTKKCATFQFKAEFSISNQYQLINKEITKKTNPLKINIKYYQILKSQWF